MAILKSTYQAIKTQLEAEATSIQHIGLYNSQFDNEEQENIYPYPNAFIEFSQIDWIGKANQTQQVDIEITIHIGLWRLEDEPFAELNGFDIVEEVYLALQGFCGFQRFRDEQDINHGQVIVWKTLFRTRLVDEAADPDDGKGTAFPVTLEINGDLDIDDEVIRTGDGVF